MAGEYIRPGPKYQRFYPTHQSKTDPNRYRLSAFTTKESSSGVYDVPWPSQVGGKSRLTNAGFVL
jgi:hypothetical protein